MTHKICQVCKDRVASHFSHPSQEKYEACHKCKLRDCECLTCQPSYEEVKKVRELVKRRLENVERQEELNNDE